MSELVTTDERAKRRAEMLNMVDALTPQQWLRLIVPSAAAQAIARHYGLSYPEVIKALDQLPADLAPFFDDPRGWTMLGIQIAAGNGIGDIPPMFPQVH